MEKFRNGRHTDSCLTWSHTIFGRAFKFIKQRRFQVDYACAFLHIFLFSIMSWWPLLLCFSIFPPTKILDTPRRALTGHRQQVHVLQLLNIAAAIFLPKTGRDSWISYLFSFVLSGTTTTTWRVQRVVWGGFVFHHRPNEPIATEKKVGF